MSKREAYFIVLGAVGAALVYTTLLGVTLALVVIL